MLVASSRFEGNTADLSGAARIGGGGAVSFDVLDEVDVRVEDTEFVDNDARNGGALRAESGGKGQQLTLSVVRSRFEGNGRSAERGGAVQLEASGKTAGSVTDAARLEAHFVSSVWRGNGRTSTTTLNGGAVGVLGLTDGEVRARFTGSLLAGNSGSSGGAIYAEAFSGAGSLAEIIVDYSTIASNWSDNFASDAGAVHVDGDNASATVSNSILWGNGSRGAPSLPPRTDAVDQIGISEDGGSATINQSIVQGSMAGLPTGVTGSGVTDADPAFVNPRTFTGAPTTLGDYRLATGSAALGGGALPLPGDALDVDGDGDTAEPLPLDLAGNARQQDGAPDLGAYEGENAPGRGDGLGEVDGPFVYVRVGATGSGASWTDALGSVADALSTATSGQSVLVARGTYKPTASDDRTATFEIPVGVGVYGGWSGTEGITQAGFESALAARDLQANTTILTGDLKGDDVALNSFTRRDNSHHVITTRLAGDELVTLNGLTVRGGDATGVTERGFNMTGGLLIILDVPDVAADIAIRDVVFESNYGSSSFKRDVFVARAGRLVNNSERYRFRFRAARVQFDGAVFLGHQQTGDFLMNLDAELDEVTLGDDGRLLFGVWGDHSDPAITNRASVRNLRGGSVTAQNFGSKFSGHDDNYLFDLRLVNLRETQVIAALMGGGDIRLRASNVLATGSQTPPILMIIDGWASNPSIVAELDGVTIAGNGMLNPSTPSGHVALELISEGFRVSGARVDLTLRNSILWGNGDGSLTSAYKAIGSGATLRFENSIVQGSGGSGAGWTTNAVNGAVVVDLGGNRDADPAFLDPNPTTQGTPPDFRLGSGSAAIDAGALPLPADLLDVDDDGDTAEPLPLDLAGVDRLQGAAPDLGAFEGRFGDVLTPLPQADAYDGATEDAVFTVAAANGVLANDTQTGGGRPARAVLVTPLEPGVASVDLADDGGFTLTPQPNASGDLTFSYRAVTTDDVASDPTVVTVAFDPVPDAPVAQEDLFETTEDATLVIGEAQGVLANDTDADGDRLEAVLEPGNGPFNGTLALDALGGFTYTPARDFFGEDGFTYRARDPGGLTSDFVSVSIRIASVDDPPVASDLAYEATAGETLVVPAPGLLDGVTDAEEVVEEECGDEECGEVRQVQAFAVSDPASGTISVDLDGGFVYTPDAGFAGIDAFDYAGQDSGGQRDTARVTITVQGPPTARDDAYTLDEDGGIETLRNAQPFGVLANDDDPNGDALTAVLIDAPVIAAQAFSFNDLDGTFSYVPRADFFGTETFRYAAVDPSGRRDTATVTLTVRNVADAPVAQDDAFSGEQGQVLRGNVRLNDTDADRDTLRIALSTAATTDLGTLTLATNGDFAFAPNGPATGTARFLYSATDPSGLSSSAWLDVEIRNSVSDAPVAADVRFDGVENQPLTVAAPGALTGDTDADGDALAAQLIDAPRWGTLDLRADGSFDFLPAADSNGVVTFRYAASDPGGLRDTATVTLDIDPRDSPPVGAPDAFQTDEDVVLTVLAASANSLLQNDRSPDGLGVESFEALLVDSTANGRLTPSLSTGVWRGGFEYLPNPDFNGTDGFTYRVRDSRGLTSEPVAVTIAVRAVSDGQEGVADRDTTREDTPLIVTAPGVLANDPNPDGAARTVRLTGDEVRGGSVALDSDGGFTFTPAPDYASFAVRADGVVVRRFFPARFTYEIVSDGAVSDPVSVEIEIEWANDVPVARDDAFTLAEDETLEIAAPGVLANDSDADLSESARFSNIDVDVQAFVVQSTNLGTATLGPDGALVYTPRPGVSGRDSLGYRVYDRLALGVDGATIPGDTSGVAWAHFDITGIADAPVANADTFYVDEDETLTVAAPGVLSNDTDGDGDALTVVGLLAEGTSIGGVVSAWDGAVDLQADGRLTFTPSPNVNGTQRLFYQIEDPSGQRSSPAGLIVIEVAPVNDRPVVGANFRPRLFATEDQALVVARVPGGTDFSVPFNPLNLDTDLEDGFATTGRVVEQPTIGTVRFDEQGTLTFTPDADATGPGSFRYVAIDSEGAQSADTARVGVFIEPVNDAPVAANDTLTIAEDTSIDPATLLANDRDIDSPIRLFAQQPYRSANGQIARDGTYTPNADYAGVDSFAYVIEEEPRLVGGAFVAGLRDTAQVFVTITPVADAPRPAADDFAGVEDETFTANVLANDSDPDGDALTALLVDGPTRGTLDFRPDGTFDLSLPADSFGVSSFRYAPRDATGLVGDTVVAAVTFANVPDLARPQPDAFATLEDAPLVLDAPGVLGNDVDVDGLGLRAIATRFPRNGTLDLALDGSLTYTPQADFAGADTIRYESVNSVGQGVETEVVITVTPQPDAPVAVADAYDLAEDASLTVMAGSGVLFNDTDADGDALTASLVESPRWGTLDLSANGSFTFTPARDSSGVVTFRYSASDGALAGEATVTLTVAPQPDAPIASDTSYATDEDATLTVAAADGVLSNDADVDGDVLTASIVESPRWGTLDLLADGGFTFTPARDSSGVVTFRYSASDGALSDEATVTLTVAPQPDAPTASDASYATDEDATLTVAAADGVLANDRDADGDALTASLVESPRWGTLDLLADGGFTFTPAPDSSGVVTFRYSASDGALAGEAAVTITVAPQPDAPIARVDTLDAVQGVQLVLSAPGVLGNDRDADAQPLSAQLVTDVSNGSLNVASDGSLTYTSDTRFVGDDRFVYRASDGSLVSSDVEVLIRVAANPDLALTALDDAYATGEDTTLTVIAPGVLANDTDGNGDALSATLVTAPDALAGTLALATDGGFVFTPAPDFFGSASFVYRVSDPSGVTDTATVTLTVRPSDDAPRATADSLETAEDTPLDLAAPGLLANDSDPENSPLTARLARAARFGAATVRVDGSVRYVPSADFAGVDTFAYVASDGALTSDTTLVFVTVGARPDAPTARPVAFEVAEDDTLDAASPGVLANASDTDGDALVALVVASPRNGTLDLQLDGSFRYVPRADFAGADTFAFRVRDADSLFSSPTTAAITVAPVADAPIAADASYRFAEDTILTLPAPGVLAGDVDADGDPLTAVLVTPPTQGTATLASDGALVYTPNADFSGLDSLVYAASDGALADTAIIRFEVVPSSDAPLAVDTAFAGTEDEVLTVAAPGVLANDRDADGDALTASLVEPPRWGTLDLASGGGFTFAPAPDSSGVVTFRYSASDGALADTATVTLTIAPVNDAPVAAADRYEVAEDEVLTIAATGGVLANDTDVDGDALTASVVESPRWGTLDLSANGGFTFTPAPDSSGVVTFRYSASDGALSNGATVTITVGDANDAPVASDATYATDEDATLVVAAASGVLAGDRDADGDALTASLVESPRWGTLDLSADGGFAFAPAPDSSGVVTFRYSASDGALADTATVTLTIAPVNDAPVALADRYEVGEDEQLVIEAASGVLANDRDADGDTLTTTLVESPRWGTLDLSADGGFTFTPAPDSSGVVTFRYSASDGALADAATVTITVGDANDAPLAANSAFVGTEDEALTAAAPGVLANDRDADGDALTASLVESPRWGTLSLASDGGFAFAPAPDSSGVVTFRYAASDGTLADTATVTLTIAPINDAPVALADRYDASEETDLIVAAADGVLANDRDADADALTATLIDSPRWGTLSLASDGGFAFAPAPDSSGVVTFRYSASDGALADTSTITVVVGGANDAPVASADSYEAVEDEVLTVAARGVLANDRDADGDVLTTSVVESPRWGTLDLSADGGFTFKPAPDSSGVVTFRYSASDGALADTATVTLTIASVADVPVASADTYETVEDEVLTVAARGVLANDRDADGDVLTASVVESPRWGTLDLSADGGFTFKPAPDSSGVVTFRYSASDGALADTATVTITIDQTNDAPVASNASFATDEDAKLTVSASDGVLAGDRDTDGDVLTASLVESPRWGTLDLSSDGGFAFTPAPDSSGVVTFRYAASDGALADTAVVTLEIESLPDAPVAAPRAFATVEDEPLTVASGEGVLLGSRDADADTLTASVVASPRWGVLDLSSDGGFTFTPAPDSSGVVTFRYSASDGALADTATATITVERRNDAPITLDDALASAEDSVLVVSLSESALANDRDPDGDALTVSLVDQPALGTVTLSDGRLTYTPAPDSSGVVTFRYSASDGLLADTATVTLTLAPVNDAPVANEDQAFVQLATSVTVDVLANDTDVEGDVLTLVSAAARSDGQAVVENGRLRFTPDPSAEGAVNVDYTIRDSEGATAMGILRVTVITSVYTATDLGTLGGEGARAFAIDDQGRVVGVAQDDQGVVRPFVWQGGAMTFLGTQQGQAYAVDGSAVVGVTTQGGEAFAALWNTSAPASPPTLLSTRFSQAYDVAGAFVVGAALDGSRLRAARWQGGGEELLATPGTASSQALGVEPSGRVAGSITQADGRRAAVWTRDGALRLLDNGAALAINAQGTAVGASQGHAAVWRDGVRALLDSSDVQTEALRINDAGTIVGGRVGSVSAKSTHPVLDPAFDPLASLRAPGKDGAQQITGAFVWERGYVTDLNATLRDADGVDLIEARDVNSKGQIVGYALIDGVPRAFLLQPASNRAPTAAADLFTAFAGRDMTFAPTANDTDADGDSLFVLAVDPPTSGRAWIAEDGSLGYRAAPGSDAATDVFDYVVGDGKGGSARATVNLRIESFPDAVRIDGAWPNPFGDRTSIRFAVPDERVVRLDLFDALGRHVATLADRTFDAGVHHIPFDASRLGAGVYFCRVQAGDTVASIAVTRVR